MIYAVLPLVNRKRDIPFKFEMFYPVLSEQLMQIHHSDEVHHL